MTPQQIEPRYPQLKLDPSLSCARGQSTEVSRGTESDWVRQQWWIKKIPFASDRSLKETITSPYVITSHQHLWVPIHLIEGETKKTHQRSERGSLVTSPVYRSDTMLGGGQISRRLCLQSSPQGYDLELISELRVQRPLWSLSWDLSPRGLREIHTATTPLKTGRWSLSTRWRRDEGSTASEQSWRVSELFSRSRLRRGEERDLLRWSMIESWDQLVSIYRRGLMLRAIKSRVARWETIDYERPSGFIWTSSLPPQEERSLDGWIDWLWSMGRPGQLHYPNPVLDTHPLKPESALRDELSSTSSLPVLWSPPSLRVAELTGSAGRETVRPLHYWGLLIAGSERPRDLAGHLIPEGSLWINAGDTSKISVGGRLSPNPSNRKRFSPRPGEVTSRQAKQNTYSSVSLNKVLNKVPYSSKRATLRAVIDAHDVPNRYWIRWTLSPALSKSQLSMIGMLDQSEKRSPMSRDMSIFTQWSGPDQWLKFMSKDHFRQTPRWWSERSLSPRKGWGTLTQKPSLSLRADPDQGAIVWSGDLSRNAPLTPVLFHQRVSEMQGGVSLHREVLIAPLVYQERCAEESDPERLLPTIKWVNRAVSYTAKWTREPGTEHFRHETVLQISDELAQRWPYIKEDQKRAIMQRVITAEAEHCFTRELRP